MAFSAAGQRCCDWSKKRINNKSLRQVCAPGGGLFISIFQCFDDTSALVFRFQQKIGPEPKTRSAAKWWQTAPHGRILKCPSIFLQKMDRQSDAQLFFHCPPHIQRILPTTRWFAVHYREGQFLLPHPLSAPWSTSKRRICFRRLKGLETPGTCSGSLPLILKFAISTKLPQSCNISL
jgi:hypothetical protein